MFNIAIKLSRRYSREIMKKERFEVITMFGSFHGRTYGAVSATAQEKFHQGFEPMVPGFRYVPFNDSKAVEAAVTDKTCAILVEPVQGEGGVKVPAPGYLKALRKICDEHQLLLVLDEIQTGMGRTGRLFAYEHEGITPDIMALAKGLGSGMPVGALLASDKASQAFVPGTHGSTFGGNPLACAAGLASLEALLEGNVFQGLNDAQLEKLAAIAKEEAYPTGALLYKEGDPSSQIYLVQQGKVFLEMKCDMGPTRPPMQVIIDVVTRREAFGWSTFVEPNLHTLSALIAEPTKMIIFDDGKMKALMDEDCQMGFEIMKGLTRLLASRLNHTRVLLIGERALATLTSNTEYA